MTETLETSFLPVEALLAQSEPRARGGWGWYVVGAFLLVALLGAWAGQQIPQAEPIIHLLSAAVIFAMIIVVVSYTSALVKRQRAEQQQLEAVEELVQLRRWSHAAAALQGLLSRPMRTPQGRVQGLIYLTSILCRYHRFHDAIEAQEYLLAHFHLDPDTTLSLRLGRAMALLHENRLFDADRAISDLRRSGESEEAGGLAMVEIYRDVMTGHPDEALAIFSAKQTALKRQLGIRMGDAYALAARAHDLLGRAREAQDDYTNATLLTPEIELARRYPEVGALRERYIAAATPAVVSAPAA